MLIIERGHHDTMAPMATCTHTYPREGAAMTTLDQAIEHLPDYALCMRLMETWDKLQEGILNPEAASLIQSVLCDEKGM